MKRGTISHPKTYRLARELRCTHLLAVGILEALWHWAARYAIRGDVGKFDDAELAAGIMYDGDPHALVEALVAARWLDRHATYRLVIHDWQDHADESTRKTLKNRGFDWITPEPVTIIPESFRKSREKARNGRPQPLPEPVPEPFLDTYPPSSAAADVSFDLFWQLYPKKVARKDAEQAWRRLQPTAWQAAVLMQAVVLATQSPQWRDGFIPHAATWIHGRRWLDDLNAPRGSPTPTSPLADTLASIKAITEERAHARLRSGPITGGPVRRLS